MPSPISRLITRDQHDACVGAIRRGLKRTLQVREPLTGSQWADKHFYLSPESSGNEGKWESLPYQVGLLDVMGADEPRIVDLRKSARIGYTKMLDAIVAYNVEHKRRNTVMYQPTDGDAKDFCKSEIDPMVRDVPVLAQLADEGENKKRDDTLTMKRLGQKLLYILGGKAPARFRRVTADTVVYDELDGFDREIGEEGDPLFLGDRCITNSSFPKSIRGSTPRLKHDSLIEQEVERASILFQFYVACVECDEMQPLLWRRMRWGEDGTNEDRASTAHYRCAACDAPWQYRDIWALLTSGQWRSDDRTERERAEAVAWRGHRIQTGDGDPVLLDHEGMPTDWPRHVAFHIWAAYSPFVAWSELVQEWLEAQGHPLKMKTFVNHKFGETWEEAGESVDENDLFEGREVYGCPVEVLAVIATVDVQDNRVEIEVVGFGRYEECWHIEHKVIYGDTDKLDSPLWTDLDDHLVTFAVARADGVNLRIDAVGVDTGYRTEVVYRWILKARHARVFALKGVAGEGRAIAGAPSRQRTLDGKPIDLFAVGVDSAKALIVTRLAPTSQSRIHLNTDVTLEMCQQLTAEKRITKYRRGFAHRQWVKVRERNELLDLMVYAFAVLNILRPAWTALERRVGRVETKQEENKPKVRRYRKGWARNWRQ